MKECNYTKPEFYVTEFVANEYVAAACTHPNGTTVTLQCGSAIPGGEPDTLKIIYPLPGCNEGYQITSEENRGSSPQLYTDIQDAPNGVVAIFCGPISGGHYNEAIPYTSGEWTTSVEKDQESGLRKGCTCKYIQNNVAQPANEHHHITGVTYSDHS